jgi:thioredoxin reductase (NADPH)
MVIGAGPAGASAAFWAARLGWQVDLVDPLGIGGQLLNVEHLPDYPGFPAGVAGWDLAAALGEQVLDAGVALTLGRAERVSRSAHGWSVEVDGRPCLAAAVLVATGSRPRPLSGVAPELVGRGVSYCASCDAGFAAGRRAVVIGGGDIALAEAQTLAAVASEVVVVFPEAVTTASAARAATLGTLPAVRLMAGWSLCGVGVGDGRVVGVELENLQTHERQVVEAEAVFGAVDGPANGELVADVGVLDAEGAVRTDAALAVGGAAGLYAAGDVRAGTFRRAATASGEGVAAALAIDAFLRSRPPP